MKARFIRQIGVRGCLRIYWDRVRCTTIEPCTAANCGCGGWARKEWLNHCPKSYGKGSPGVHNAYTRLGDKIGEGLRKCADELFGRIDDHPKELWPTACAHCGAPVPQTEPDVKVVGQEGWAVFHQVFTERLYNTPSGQPEPGDIYITEWHEPKECPYWDNCDGKHVHGVLPNGHHWDIDSRASNCTMREDRLHRCWVKRGSAEAGTLHVDKNGPTCAAGAGSIFVEGWHGFLHNFQWVG